MGIIIGIDVGISTTKIVGIKDGKVVSPMRITAADPVTSLYGAFGKYLYENKVELSDVEQVMLTGVGSAYIDPSVMTYAIQAIAGTAIALGTFVSVYWRKIRKLFIKEFN